MSLFNSKKIAKLKKAKSDTLQKIDLPSHLKASRKLNNYEYGRQKAKKIAMSKNSPIRKALEKARE